MRPRLIAAENRNRRAFGGVVVRASMRPRLIAAENSKTLPRSAKVAWLQ